MGGRCFVRTSGSKNLISKYGEEAYNQMEEWGLAGVAPEVTDRRTGKLVASSLYQDIFNRLPSSLNNTVRAEKAFEIFIDAHSDEFFEKYGDWLQYPTDYKVGRYSSTGEPKIYTFEKDGYFKEFSEDKSDKSSAIEKTKKFLENTLIELNNKLTILQRKSVKSEDKDELLRLEKLINKIKKSIDTNENKTGVVAYLSYLNNEVLPIYKSKTESFNEEDVDSYFVDNLLDFLSTHRSNLLKLRRSLKNSKELYSFYKSEVEPVLNEITQDMGDLESFAENYIEEKVVSIAKDTYENTTKETITGWFKDTVKDITAMGRTFGIPSNLSDPVIKLVVELIKKIHYNINSIVNPAIDNLVVKQIAMNKSGVDDMSVLNEKVDGKKSGFLISEFRWGEYYTKQSEMRDKIVRLSELKDWEAVNRHVRELDKTIKKDDKIYKIFIKEINKFNKEYRDDIGKPKPKVNEEFNRLMKNPKFAEYYNTLYNIHSKAKEAQPSKFRIGANWWLLPQIKNDYLESFKSGGIKKGIAVSKRKLREVVKTTEEDIEFGDITKDKNGKIIKLVPLHYNSKLENQEELSDDISSMYHAYYKMAENFKQVSNSISDIELIYKAMERREIETPKSNAVVKNLIESQLYGQQIKDFNITIGNKTVNMSKVIDTALVKYPSIVNMFFNVPVALSGFTKGKVDTQIENFSGTHTTFESARKATVEFTRQLPNVLSEIGSRTKTNKLDLLLKHNQVDDILHKQYRNLNIDSKAGRMMTSDLTYAVMMPTGYNSLASVALSIYYNYRLVNGEFITEAQFKSKYKGQDIKWSDYKEDSLYDAYMVKDGNFVVKDKYKKYISSDFEYKISKKINALSNRLEGRTSSLEKSSIYRNPFGRGVMLHRSWIPQLFSTRFKAKGYDFDLEETNEGYYLTAFNTIKNMIGLTDGKIKLKLANWNELEEFEKANLKKFTGDLVMLATIYVLYAVANSIADDNDEDDWYIEFQAYLATRLYLEHRAFWDPTESFNIIKSPLAAINQWQSITNFFSMIPSLGEEIQSGAYKDKTRLERFLIQQSFLKNLYEVQFPKQKNTYLKSQVIK